MPGIGIDICTLIIDYAGCGMTLKEAKRRRQEVVDVRKHTKGKFGSVCFGNSGHIFYFPHGKTLLGCDGQEWDEEYGTVRDTQSALYS